MRDGDRITIDATQREINLDVTARGARAAARAWRAPAPYAPRGVLAKYAHLVSSASLGAVTDRGLTP